MRVADIVRRHFLL